MLLGNAINKQPQQIQGHILFIREKYQDSLEVYKSLSTESNNLISCQMNKALALVYNNQFSESEKIIDKLSKKYPKNSRLQSSKFQILFITQGYSSFDTLMSEETINMETLYLTYFEGMNDLKWGKFDQSINIRVLKQCDEAINQFPQNIKFYQKKGEILRELNREKEAIQVYNQALQIDPFNSSLYVSKAYALKQNKEWSQVIYCINSALTIDPMNDDFYYKKAELLYEEGKNSQEYTQALLCIDQGLALTPDNTQKLILKASILCSQLNRPKDKINCCQSLSRICLSKRDIQVESNQINPYEQDSFNLIIQIVKILVKINNCDKAFLLIHEQNIDLEHTEKIIESFGDLSENLMQSYQFLCYKACYLFMTVNYQEANTLLIQVLELQCQDLKQYLMKLKIQLGKQIEFNKAKIQFSSLLLWLLERTGSYQEAQQFFKEQNNLNLYSIQVIYLIRKRNYQFVCQSLYSNWHFNSMIENIKLFFDYEISNDPSNNQLCFSKVCFLLIIKKNDEALELVSQIICKDHQNRSEYVKEYLNCFSIKNYGEFDNQELELARIRFLLHCTKYNEYKESFIQEFSKSFLFQKSQYNKLVQNLLDNNLKLDDQNPVLYFLKACLLILIKQYKLANEFINKAIQMDPEKPSNYFKKCILFIDELIAHTRDKDNLYIQTALFINEHENIEQAFKYLEQLENYYQLKLKIELLVIIKQYEKAEKYLDQLVQEEKYGCNIPEHIILLFAKDLNDPTNLKAYCYLIHFLTKHNLYDEAFNYLDQAIELGFNMDTFFNCYSGENVNFIDYELYFQQAMILSQLSSHEEAIQFYEEKLMQNQNNFDLYFEEARFLSLLKGKVEREQVFTKYLKQNPLNSDIQHQIIRYLQFFCENQLNINQIEYLMDNFLQIIDIVIQQQTEFVEKLIKLIEKIITNKNNQCLERYIRSQTIKIILLLKIKKYKEFYQNYQETYELAKSAQKNQDAEQQLSLILNKVKQSYDKELEIDKNNPLLYYYYAKLQEINKKYQNENQNELFYIDKAIEMDKSNIEFIKYKAQKLFNLNRCQEALDCCDYAIQVDPKNLTTYINKIDILNNLKRFDEANECQTIFSKLWNETEESQN